MMLNIIDQIWHKYHLKHNFCHFSTRNPLKRASIFHLHITYSFVTSGFFASAMAMMAFGSLFGFVWNRGTGFAGGVGGGLDNDNNG